MTSHSIAKLLELPPFQTQPESSIWHACRFTMRRNLATFPFPSKIKETEAVQLSSLLKKNMGDLFQTGIFWEAKDLSNVEKEALIEHFMIENDSSQRSAHHYLMDPDAGVLIKIQEDDHLLLSTLDVEKHWAEKWEKLSGIETAIGKTLRYAFHKTFGYLTADPARCGTGLKVEAILHLPCLIHFEKMPELLEKVLGEEATYQGLGGSKELIGDFVVIINRFSLGVSEDQILDAIHQVASELVRLEKECRNLQKENPDKILKDKVCRAYGLLSHCFQITTKEAFAALSLLKLGIDLNWVTGMTDQEVTALFFQCRRAHLALKYLVENRPEQLAVKRAEVLKEACKSTALK